MANDPITKLTYVTIDEAKTCIMYLNIHFVGWSNDDTIGWTRYIIIMAYNVYSITMFTIQLVKYTLNKNKYSAYHLVVSLTENLGAHCARNCRSIV
jgi:hypothetical protein